MATFVLLAVPESVCSIAVTIALATTEVPKEPAVRRVWIVAMLRLRGTSLRRIANEQGVSHQAASNALLVPSQYIESAIADAIGVPVARLFPERFDALGNRIAQTRPQKRSTRTQARKRGAA